MINNSNFKTNIPRLNPLSIDYQLFWKEERRKCIEGYWSGGVFMPGPVYQYINHWKIELNKGKNSKNKVIDHPLLRDLEWEKGYHFMEARGFSGFEFDNYHTCERELKDSLMFFDEYENKRIIDPHPDLLKDISSNTKRYTPIRYVEARDYLRWYHPKDLGRPLMQNHSKNIVDIEARGGGKSFFASNLIAWNFLHDGVFWYEDLLKAKSETLVGAIDTKFSSGLLKKVKLGLENLTGEAKIGDIYYPPPFLKKYSGSWESGKTVVAEYDQKIGNNWVKKGSKSMIHHRSFADNPMAANGTRPGLVCLEEVGFFSNLLLALGQLKECTMDGINKFGTIWMFGTGGDMEGGSTEAVKEVFYNPEAFDCLVFNDIYENKGKIGYFVPSWKTLNQYKDEEGITDENKAKSYLELTREKLKNNKSKQALYDELQNRPIVPSEAFLVQQGNVFPVAELKEHLSFLESSKKTQNLGTTGRMERKSDTAEVFFKPDPDLTPCDYPTKYSKDFEGAVVIWEQPIDNPPYGLYIAGIDPYDQDKAENSPSLGSIIIYKRFLNADQTYHLPVAEYTARPQFANDFYEQCRRLLEFYNARALYENEKTGIKSYFETKNCLYLLHKQPNIIKSIVANSRVERVYGTHMVQQIKEQIEIYTRDWLKTELEPGILQLTKINSIPLLKELIAYNPDGNFDRVIAFMLVIMQDLDMHKILVEESTIDDDIDPFWTQPLFLK